MLTLLPRRTSGLIRMPFAGSVRSCVGDPIGVGSIGEDDAAALRPDAPGRGLELADHAQAQFPVAERRLAVADALGEMADHPLEGLARLDVRASDVAGAIADQEPVPFLGRLSQLDPPVVDLDRL